MARSSAQTPPNRPSTSASNTTATGRISKSRSDQSITRSHNTRQRSHMLQAASSSGVLQSMVDEAQNIVAGGSSKSKGKSRALAEEDMATEIIDNITDQMDEGNADDEDVDMQQALLDSVPANEVCPITDKDTKPFRLMDLPTEIRLEIYRACLTRPYDILLSKRDKPTQPEPEADLDGSGAALSDSSSDSDQSSSPGYAANTAAAPLFGNAAPSTGRATLGLQTARSARSAARITRQTSLATSRSEPGSSNNASSNDSSSSDLSTQAGASRPPAPPALPARNARFRPSAIRAGRRYASRTRTVVLPASEPPRNQSEDPLLVNILRVSKEIYKEARGVLYNENKFVLDLNTAMPTLSLLHQRSRRLIKHVELEIPTYNEILERFQETVRLSLRYCTGLKTFVIHMPFTLPGADGSGTTGNTTVYANGFDILRWLPQECDIVLKGNVCSEIEVVVNKHMHLAKTLDKVSLALLAYKPFGNPGDIDPLRLTEKDEVSKEDLEAAHLRFPSIYRSARTSD